MSVRIGRNSRSNVALYYKCMIKQKLHQWGYCIARIGGMKEMRQVGRTKLGNANAERNKNKRKQRQSSELVEFTPKDERNQKRLLD